MLRQYETSIILVNIVFNNGPDNIKLALVQTTSSYSPSGMIAIPLGCRYFGML